MRMKCVCESVLLVVVWLRAKVVLYVGLPQADRVARCTGGWVMQYFLLLLLFKVIFGALEDIFTYICITKRVLFGGIVQVKRYSIKICCLIRILRKKLLLKVRKEIIHSMDDVTQQALEPVTQSV